jgi:hypothetical protein
MSALLSSCPGTPGHSFMTVCSSFLGPVNVSGDDARSFARKVAHGRGTKGAADSVASGRTLVAEFTKNGFVTIQLKPKKAGPPPHYAHDVERRPRVAAS